MAVIQDEQGNNKPIMTDTSHVFDVNGNPLHGELFIGETIASDDVEPIDGFAHESDVDALSQSLAELADGTMPIVYKDTSKQTFANIATLEAIASNMDNTSSGVAIIYNQCGIVHKMNSSHIGMIVIAYNGAIFSFRKVDNTWSYATVSVGAYTNVTS
jgi:hypothetical protein